MIKSIVLPSLKNSLIALLLVGIMFFNSVNSAWAKRPPEIRNQQDLNLEPEFLKRQNLGKRLFLLKQK